MSLHDGYMVAYSWILNRFSKEKEELEQKHSIIKTHYRPGTQDLDLKPDRGETNKRPATFCVPRNII